MNKLFYLAVFFSSCLLASILCNASETPYKDIEWTDLMPEEDLEAILNPPEYLNEIVDGSEEDQMSTGITQALNAAETRDSAYEQALVSIKVRPEFNNKAVRIPGFIVPLTFEKEQLATSFFIVPFFGACIHVPPPPPNQIIYASYPKGIKIKALYDAYWIEGVLKTTLTENSVATSAYSIEIKNIKIYE